MKHLIYIVFLLSTVSTMANNVEQIKNAIKNGDGVALATYFDNSVEVCVLDTEDMYTSSEAKSVIIDFFAKHKPKSLSQIHKGDSKAKDAQYLTGTMIDQSGVSFRLYIYLKNVNGKLLIQEMRFDKE